MGLIVATSTEPSARDHEVPRLIAGTELLGEYEGSGFTTPQYLLRRHDGQVIRISQLLYLITAQMDGVRDLEMIAGRVSEQMDRTVSVGNVAHLVDTKLDQLGIVDGRPVTVATSTDPLLGLRFRSGLVPERLHRGITTLLRPAFAPVVVTAVLVALAGLDAWLIGYRRSAMIDGWVEILTRPGLFLGLTCVTVFAMAFHEFGHATACRYGGARPGAMGVGVYIVWPAFFTDVSDAYRLDRRGRLRTDLGGIYFNAIFALVAGAAYASTGFAPLLVLAVLTQVQALYQLVPFVRLDGYYILGDLIGVPNPFAYVKATFLAALAPRRSDTHARAQTSLHAIKRSARIVLTVWVLLAVPLLLGALALSFYLMPRTVPVIVRTLRLDAHIVAHGVTHGDWIGAANGACQFIFLTLPLLGWLSTLWYFGKYASTKKWARAIRNPRAWPRPVMAIAAVAVIVGALGVTLEVRSGRTTTAEARPTVEAGGLVAPLAAESRPTVEPPSTATAAASATMGAVLLVAPPPAPAPATPTQWALLISVDNVNALADAVPHHDTAIGTWHVESGDNFWRMAERILTDAYGRAPTAQEHGAYWAQLVDANRDRLARPGDANAIFPGQDFVVVLPAVAPDHLSLFVGPPPAAPEAP